MSSLKIELLDTWFPSGRSPHISAYLDKKTIAFWIECVSVFSPVRIYCILLNDSCHSIMQCFLSHRHVGSQLSNFCMKGYHGLNYMTVLCRHNKEMQCTHWVPTCSSGFGFSNWTWPLMADIQSFLEKKNHCYLS